MTICRLISMYIIDMYMSGHLYMPWFTIVIFLKNLKKCFLCTGFINNQLLIRKNYVVITIWWIFFQLILLAWVLQQWTRPHLVLVHVRVCLEQLDNFIKNSSANWCRHWTIPTPTLSDVSFLIMRKRWDGESDQECSFISE